MCVALQSWKIIQLAGAIAVCTSMLLLGKRNTAFARCLPWYVAGQRKGGRGEGGGGRKKKKEEGVEKNRSEGAAVGRPCVGAPARPAVGNGN